MVMKSSVEDDDAGWGLGIPEKMKNNANWVDITHEFKGACKGTKYASDFVLKLYMQLESESEITLLSSKGNLS